MKQARIQNRSISLPVNLLEQALERCERLGLKFSHYVAHLIEADVRKGGDFVIFETPCEQNEEQPEKPIEPVM